MGKFSGLMCVALLIAPSLVAYAQDGDEPSARAGGSFSPSTLDETGAAPNQAYVNKAIRMTQPMQPGYDPNAVQAPSNFAARPASAPVRIIDSNALRLELHADGQGHRAFTSPFLRGASVGASARRGGGIFKFSWPTSN